MYEGPGPRAGDATPNARAGKNATKTFEGGRKKRSNMIWREQRFDYAKSCLRSTALGCAVRLLAVSRSDRQYGCELRRRGKNRRAVKDQIYEENEEKYSRLPGTQQHVLYPVLLYVRNKAQRSTTQYCSVGHGPAPLGSHGSARLRTVLRYAAAELHI